MEKITQIVSEILNNPFNYIAYKKFAQYYFDIGKSHEGNAILKLTENQNDTRLNNTDANQK